MPPFTVARNRIDYTSGTFDFVSTTIKFRPNVMAAADYICTLHEDAIEILLVASPPTTTTGKIYNHSGKIKWNGEGLAYDSEVVHNNAVGEINALDNKAAPVADDVLLIEDSETSYSKKNILISGLPGGSGTDDDAIHDNVVAEISAITEKTALIGTDLFLIEDSAASNAKKKVKLENLPQAGCSNVLFETEIETATDALDIPGLEGVTRAVMYLDSVNDSASLSNIKIFVNEDVTDADYDTTLLWGSGTTATSQNHDDSVIANNAAGKLIQCRVELTIIDGRFFAYSTVTRESTADGRPEVVVRVVRKLAADVTDLSGMSLGTVTDGLGVGTKVIIYNPLAAMNVERRIAVFEDQKPSLENGGTLTQDIWQDRDLNAVVEAAAGITLASDQITLTKGHKYLVNYSCPAYYVGRHQAKLYNVTNAGDEHIGSSAYTSSSQSNSQSRSYGECIVDLTAASVDEVFKLQHFCEATNLTTGMGVASETGEEEIYSRVRVERLGDLAGGIDTDAIHSNVDGEIDAITSAKAVPISGDLIIIEDSVDSYAKKKVEIGNLPGGSGTDDDAIHDNVSGEISIISAKTTPIGADYLLIEDSEESANKKRITISQLPGGSGTDDDAIHDNVPAEISAITEKTTLIGTDLVLIEDSADSNNKKKVKLENLPKVGGTNVLFETTVETDTNSISITGLTGVTRAVMYLDHINGSASSANVRLYVDDDIIDSNYKAIYVFGNGSTATSGQSSEPDICNTRGSKRSQAKIDMTVIDGVFFARTSLTLEDTDGDPDVVERSVAKIAGDAVTDLSGMSLGGITDAFGVGTKVVVVDPNAAMHVERRIAVFEQQKPTTEHGGTFTSGAWRDRILNTTVEAAAGITLDGSNQITLAKGHKYLVSYSCPAYLTNRHQARLYNVTTPDTQNVGSNEYSSSTSPRSSTRSFGECIVDLTAASTDEVFKLQHRCEVTRADVGFGIASNFGEDEIYSQIRVERLGDLAGGIDTDAIHDNVAGEIADITEKTAPINTDLLVIEDSDDSNNKKRVQLGNLPGGGSNILFEKTIATATDTIEIPGLEDVTRAVMYLDHVNGSASSAGVKIYVNSDDTDSNYDCINLWGSGSSALSNSSASPLVCNTRGDMRAQVKIELTVIDGTFFARTTHSLESASASEPAARSVVKNLGDAVTDLSGMSLGAITDGFGIGTKVVVIDPLAASGGSNVLYRETVTAEKQTIDIGNLTGKQSARIYLKHKAGGTGDKNVRIFVNGDTDNGDYEGVTWGAGYSSTVIASPSISNCVSGATNMVTIDVEINNGVVYMTGYERRRSESAQAFLVRHIFYDTEVVDDLSQLQLVAAESDGFGVGTEITVVDPFAAVREDRKIAIFEEQQDAGTESGGATAGSYEIRELNTTVNAAPGITLDGSYQITLMKGHKYHVRWEVPAYKVGKTKSRLYNVTNVETEHAGATGYANSTTLNAHAYCNGDCVVDLTAASTDEVFTVQHRVQITNAINGHGVASDLGEREVYTRAVVERL